MALCSPQATESPLLGYACGDRIKKLMRGAMGCLSDFVVVFDALKNCLCLPGICKGWQVLNDIVEYGLAGLCVHVSQLVASDIVFAHKLCHPFTVNRSTSHATQASAYHISLLIRIIKPSPP